MNSAEDIAALLDALPIAAVALAADGRVLGANAAATEVFGAAMNGLRISALVRDPPIVAAIEQALAKPERRDTLYQRQIAGQTHHYHLNIAPLQGGPTALMTLIDETAGHAASAMRSDFVANVSHELRTPLTALIGLIETLQGPAAGDAEARAEFLDHMGREAARMNRLVQDLLSLSRVQDEAAWDPQELDLTQIISAAMASLAELAESNAVSLDLRGGDAPVPLRGDPDQLRQVFNNLIENAVKYGGPGNRVAIALTQSEDQPLLGGPGMRIDVTDMGEGIAEEHIARLTERFYRVDKHRSRGSGGTGLGLAIVKHIVSCHGGYLRITSTLGKGSTFSVFLPKSTGTDGQLR